MSKSIESLERLYKYIKLIKKDIANIYDLRIYKAENIYFIVICKYDKGQTFFVDTLTLSKEDYESNKNIIAEINCYLTVN